MVSIEPERQLHEEPRLTLQRGDAVEGGPALCALSRQSVLTPPSAFALGVPLRGSGAEKSSSPLRDVQSGRVITFKMKTTPSTHKLISNLVLRVTQKTHHTSPSHLVLPEYSCSEKKINKQIVAGSRLVPTAKGFQGCRLGPEVLERR